MCGEGEDESLAAVSALGEECTPSSDRGMGQQQEGDMGPSGCASKVGAIAGYL